MTLRPCLQVLGLALLSVVGPGPGLAAGPAQLDWDRNASALVLRFEERSDKLSGVDPIVLELWGDGRIVAIRPEPYARAGVHEARLSLGEMEQVLRGIATPAFVDFEAARVQEELRSARRQRRAVAGSREAPLVYRSEKERASLELRLSKYRPEGGRTPRAVEQRVEWRGLRQDLDEFAEQESLRALAGAFDAARAVLARALEGER